MREIYFEIPKQYADSAKPNENPFDFWKTMPTEDPVTWFYYARWCEVEFFLLTGLSYGLVYESDGNWVKRPIPGTRRYPNQQTASTDTLYRCFAQDEASILEQLHPKADSNLMEVLYWPQLYGISRFTKRDVVVVPGGEPIPDLGADYHFQKPLRKGDQDATVVASAREVGKTYPYPVIVSEKVSRVLWDTAVQDTSYYREWRYFVIDGKIVNCSAYTETVPMPKSYSADEAAEAFVKAYPDLSDGNYVVDFMETQDRGVVLVEINSIHSSGCYLGNVWGAIALAWIGNP